MTKARINELVEDCIQIRDRMKRKDFDYSDLDAIADIINLVYHNIDKLKED